MARVALTGLRVAHTGLHIAHTGLHIAHTGLHIAHTGLVIWDIGNVGNHHKAGAMDRDIPTHRPITAEAIGASIFAPMASA